MENSILVLGGILAGFTAGMNLFIYKKIKNNVNQLNANGKIRNVDYLIIGETCNYREMVPENINCFVITAPNKSLTASFEVLRHTHSILKDKGTVLIVDKGYTKRTYTVFDILYFHPVTIKRLNLSKLERFSRFPLVTNTWASIKMLFADYNRRGWREECCPMRAITKFCEERELKLIYIKLD